VLCYFRQRRNWKSKVQRWIAKAEEEHQKQIPWNSGVEVIISWERSYLRPTTCIARRSRKLPERQALRPRSLHLTITRTYPKPLYGKLAQQEWIPWINRIAGRDDTQWKLDGTKTCRWTGEKTNSKAIWTKLRKRAEAKWAKPWEAIELAYHLACKWPSFRETFRKPQLSWASQAFRSPQWRQESPQPCQQFHTSSGRQSHSTIEINQENIRQLKLANTPPPKWQQWVQKHGIS